MWAHVCYHDTNGHNTHAHIMLTVYPTKKILAQYAKANGFHNTMFFVGDGISGTTFDRPGFQRMQRMI